MSPKVCEQISAPAKGHESEEALVVALKCNLCGADCGVNVEPKHHVDAGNHIAVRRRECPRNCVGKWIYLVPRDDARPWMKTTTVEKQQWKEAKLAAKSSSSDTKEYAPSDFKEIAPSDSEAEIIFES